MKVAVVMGSQSDLPIMQEAIDFLKEKLNDKKTEEDNNEHAVPDMKA